MWGRRVGTAFAVVAATMGLVACGDPPSRASVGAGGDQVAIVDAGPAVLPPDDAPALAGLTPVEVVDPERSSAEVDEYAGYSPGFAALYADPTLEDPFTGPWVLAVVHQGSENSGLAPGAFDPYDTGTTWTDVPVEQLSQESRVAGVISSGIDARSAQQLADGARVSAKDRIELSDASLDEASTGLGLVASGRLDVAFLGNGIMAPAPGPTVRWATSRDWTDDLRSARVTSYAADPDLELLLRASIGGRSEGPVIVPSNAPPDDVLLGLRTMGSTIALVQTVRLDRGELHGILKPLEPVDGRRWTELAAAAEAVPPAPMSPDPAAVTSGTVPGGTYTADVGVSTSQGEWGEFETCMESLAISYTDGSFGGGGSSGGACSEFGSVQLTSLRGGGALVVGSVPGSAASVRLEFDDGEVAEPELSGERRRMFSLVRTSGAAPLRSVVVSTADGAPIASGSPGDATTPDALGSEGSSSGFALSAPG